MGRIVDLVAVWLFADDLDVTSLGVAAQHCCHAMRAVELDTVLVEDVENLSGRQRSVRVSFFEHGANALELALPYPHTYL
jgi:hypothetical protein